MLDKIVAGFLTSYLGEYFENIDTEQVKISLWGGNVNLKHLKVRKDALRLLDIPFCISQGVIVNLSVTIPWTKLQSESIVIRLTDVTLVVEEKGAAEYSVAQCLLDAVHRRRQELANAEEAMLSDFSARFAENQDAKATGNTEDDELSNTFSARLKATMLNNVKLEITNVRILYRAFSDKDNKLTEVILNIGEVTTYACDETYTPTFNSVKLKMLYKVLAIKGVSISLAKENVSKPYPMVKPFDLSVNVQYQPIPYDAQQPKFLVGILLNQVQTNVSSTQIRLLTATSRQLLGAYHREEKRLLRPQSCSPTSDPRAWWSYAIQCTILDLRLRHQSKTSSLSWKKFLDVKQKRDSYAALYARSRRSTLKATGWLETLTAVEEQQMKTLEEELPIETVKLARRIAVERVDLERKEYLKFKEQKQLQQQQQSPDAAAEVKKEEQPPEQKGWFSSWWSGSSAGSNVKSKIVEQLESETPQDQKQIKEMIGLVNAAHWGEAERLVIAKEFGLTAEEAKELEQQPLAAPQTLDSTVQWRVFFHYRSSTVDFFENDDPPREGERGFFTLLLSGFTVGVEIGPDGAANTWAVIDQYSAVSLCNTGKGKAERRHVISVSQPGEKEDATPFDMLATITNLSPSAFSTTLAALQSRAVVLVTCEKKTAAQTSGALLSQAVLSPIEVYVELSWLERVVNFAVETIQLTEGTTTQEVDIETPEGKELDPFYTEPITLTAREVQEMADPKARLLSLAHLLEKDYMVDWAVTLKGVTLSVVEVHEAQSSKLVVRDVHVKNDIQRKLKRSERLLNQNNNNAAERFGSVEDDWVNYVLIDMEVSAFCQYVPLVAADGKAVWQPLLEPTPLEIVAKKNLFARRQPQYAALSVEVSIPQTLKLNLSRSRLSVFCFSFSLITDFMQSVSRRMMVHKGQTGTTAGPNSSTKLFEVELLEMDARYTQDHYNEVSKSEVYYASFSPTSIQCTTAKKRFVEVKNGLLTVFHACRPTYPHTIYELVKGHYHIVDGEHNTIDIFMENGGLDHFTARKDYLASRRLFEETLQFPMFDGNFVLFKRFVENWINEHKNQMSDVPVEEVEKALLCMENASHTVPASHITVRCKDSAELGQLKTALSESASDKHVYTKTADIMNRYENVVPAQIHGQRILAFSCKLPCLHLSLLEEELRVGETSSTRRPFTTKSLVMRNVKIGGEQFIQSQTYTVVASSFAIKENRSDEGKQQVEQDLFRMGCHDPADGDGRRDPNVFIAIELLSQPGNYPSLMKSTVKCRPLEEGSMHVEVCSALMESLELLYDLSGVLFDKALNYNNRILCCTPWHRDQWSPEHSRAVEEEYTTNRCTGGQFCQTWELHIPSNVFRLYYPKDEEEFCQAEEAASWGDTPFLTYSCDAVKVEFHQTTAMKTTTMTLGNSKLQAAYLAEDGSLQWNEVLLPDENCQMHVTFEVNSCVPSLSLSDFIANGGDADTPEGVRATHHLRIQSSGNFMLYTQHEMMRWVELGTKGVVSRGMSILERQPFLYALPERQENAVQPAPLLPWPRPKDTLVQPYTWCVMKKTMSFEALRLRLTTSDEGSNGSLASTKDTVSVKVKRLRVEDQWDNTPVEKEAKPETISSHMVITFTNMIGLESASVRLHTMFSHLQFRFSWLLFQPKRITTVTKRVNIDIGDYVFHGNAADFHQLCQFYVHNYVRNSFRPRCLSASTTLPEPLWEYSSKTEQPAETNSLMTVHMAYFCFHMIECLGRPGEARQSDGTFARLASSATVGEKLTLALMTQDAKKGSQYRLSLDKVSVFDLSHLSNVNDPQRVVFKRHPTEVATEKEVEWIKLVSAKEGAPGMTLKYDSRAEETGNQTSEVSCSFGSLRVVVVPQFWFNLRDTLCGQPMLSTFSSMKSKHAAQPTGEATSVTSVTMAQFSCVIPNITQANTLLPLLEVGLENVQYERDSTRQKLTVQRFSPQNGFYTFPNSASLADETDVQQSVRRPIFFTPPAFSGQAASPGNDLLDDLFGQAAAAPPPKVEEEPPVEENWFSFEQESAAGIACTLTNTWFLMPHTSDLLKLHRLLQEGGLSHLGSLSTVLEERAEGEVVPTTSEREWPEVAIQIKRTSFLLAQHGTNPQVVQELKHGMLLSSGDMQLSIHKKQTTVGNVPTKHTKLELRIPLIRLATLSNLARELIQPFSTAIVYQLSSSESAHAVEAMCTVDRIQIKVALEYYELLLRSSVRHLVLSPAGSNQKGYSQVSADMKSLPKPPRLSEMFGSEKLVKSVTTTLVKKPSSDVIASPKAESLRLTLNLDGFSMRVMNKDTTVFLEQGEMKGYYVRSTFNKEGAPITVTEAKLELPFFKVGVEGTRPLLDINKASDDDEGFNLCQRREGDEEEITASLGVTTAYLDANAVVSAIALLYTPYARIVLPEYSLNEVKTIDRDLTLSDNLVLSGKVKMHVSNALHNHITINASGNHIYLYDNKEGNLLFLDNGVTLRIINAKIHLKEGTQVEYYAQMGNGSYIVAERPSNTFFTSRAELAADIREEALDTIVEKTVEIYQQVRRKIVTRGRLHIYLTEPEKLYNQNKDRSSQRQSLHFQVDLSAVINSLNTESVDTMGAVVDVANLRLMSESKTSEGEVVERTPLLSNWTVQVVQDRSTERRTVDGKENSETNQTLALHATDGLEVNLRYSDIFVCASALQHAQRALQLAVGSVDVSSFTALLSATDGNDYLNQLKLQEAVAEKTEAGCVTVSTTHITLPFVNIFLVNDSGKTVVPLLHFFFDGVNTPRLEHRGPSQKWHVNFSFTGEYYDFETTAWSPFVEKVLVDVIVNNVANQSVEDVLNRRGKNRLGVHVQSLKLHLSPMFLLSVRRLLDLREKFFKEQTFISGQNSGASDEKEEFLAYKIIQSATAELKVVFAQDSLGRFPPTQTLAFGDEFNFSFPSVNGKELPPSQRSVMISIGDNPAEMLSIAYRGKQRILLRKGLTRCPLVADITIENGKKVVHFRSNVLLENKLHFPIILAEGLGKLAPQASLSIPIEKLRHRMEFIPVLDGASESCSLGIRYESLPDLEGQNFVCVSQIIQQEAARRGAPDVMYKCKNFEIIRRLTPPTSFFLLKVRSAIDPRRGQQFRVPSQVVSEEALGEDVKGLFTAPFFVRNKLELPITLNCLQLREGGDKSKKLFGLGVPSIGKQTRYEFVHGAEVAPNAVHGMTQIDPCEDTYITVVIQQRSGGKIGLGQNGNHPVCVYSPRRNDLAETLTIEDQETGAKLVLRLSYIHNEVVITCPFFIINQTQHLLQITDLNPKKGDKAIPIAGIAAGGRRSVQPNDGFPFLYNSERSQSEDKVNLFLSVGYYANHTQLQWSGWSDGVPIAELIDNGVFNCRTPSGAVLSLSYSVELAPGALGDATRLVVIRPRWIVINKSPRSLFYRQRLPGNKVTEPIRVGGASCEVLDTVYMTGLEGDHNNGDVALQVQFDTDAEHRSCEYSTSFSIKDEGDYTFNIRHEHLTRLSDYWPQGEGATRPETLPPIQPEDIVDINSELYFSRMETEVMLVSCFRRCNSITYVVVSIMDVAPFVIENRTEYMVHVKQRDLPITMSIYPKTTKPFAWHNAREIPSMRLWVSDGENTMSSPSIDIDFSPEKVIRNSEQFQQEIMLPHQSNRLLFVRVRGIHGTSYAVSITNEPSIDAYRTLPYAQLFYHFKIDALYMLFTDSDRADRLLLTMRPIDISYEQGIPDQPSTGGNMIAAQTGDLQTVNFSVKTVQLDDERIIMKQKVVFQTVDVNPVAVKVTRCLLRTTPILFMPKVETTFPPFELHVEDSFIFDTMQYMRELKEVWYGDSTVKVSSGKVLSDKRGNTSIQQSSFSEVCPWVSDSLTVAAEDIQASDTTQQDPASPATATPTTGDAKPKKNTSKTNKLDWRLRTLFMERFNVDPLLLSVSLYRSPGSQKDPMFQSLGVFSLLLRSVEDARLDWPKIDQQNVCQSVWMLANYYYIQYKNRFRSQSLNLLNVAGLHAMRGFVTDLLQARYMDDTPTIPRQKSRVGRRREAQFAKDKGGDQANPFKEVNSPGALLSKGENEKLYRMYQNSLKMSFDTFLANASMDEMAQYGHLFLKQAIRRSSVFPVVNMRDLQVNNESTVSILGALTRGEPAALQRANTIHSMCHNCTEVEQIRQIYLEGDPPRPLPHPKEGIVTYGNLAHHMSWAEITKVCSASEIQQYKTLWKECAIGVPKNMVRIENN